MNILDKTTLKEQFEIVWHPRDDRRPMRRSPPPRRGRSPSPYGRRRSPSFRRGRSPRWISKRFHHLKSVGVFKDIFLLIYHRWQYLNLASFPPAPEGTEDLQVPAGEGVEAPDTGGVARHSSGDAPPRQGGETTGDKETASTLNFPTRSNL